MTSAYNNRYSWPPLAIVPYTLHGQCHQIVAINLADKSCDCNLPPTTNHHRQNHFDQCSCLVWFVISKFISILHLHDESSPYLASHNPILYSLSDSLFWTISVKPLIRHGQSWSSNRWWNQQSCQSLLLYVPCSGHDIASRQNLSRSLFESALSIRLLHWSSQSLSWKWNLL